MSELLTKEQVEDLLEYIGVDKVGVWKGNNVQFCCPIHGESHPSCGITTEAIDRDTGKIYQAFNCLACGEHGNLVKFLWKSMPDDFKTYWDAAYFMQERYNLFYEFDPDSVESVARYDEQYEDNDESERRIVKPKYFIAPFESGKKTYKYFFERGFTKSEMKEYMIGLDRESKTITIPDFWEDGQLAGVIGRYVSPHRRHNERYKIYDYPKNDLIYPLDKIKPINNTIIIMESMLDTIRVRRLGYENAGCIKGMLMSARQARWLRENCACVIDLFDNDSGGIKARRIAKERLYDINYKTCVYPEYGKDPCDWEDEDLIETIESAKTMHVFKVPRL